MSASENDFHSLSSILDFMWIRLLLFVEDKMRYSNGTWCFIVHLEFDRFNLDVLGTSCRTKFFESVALLSSSAVMVMFEQFVRLFHTGDNRSLTPSLLIVWLLATVPHSRFVMCYFNRLSGRWKWKLQLFFSCRINDESAGTSRRWSRVRLSMQENSQETRLLLFVLLMSCNWMKRSSFFSDFTGIGSSDCHWRLLLPA